MMDFGRALEDCEKSISIDANYAKAYTRKAAIEFFLKKCADEHRAARPPPTRRLGCAPRAARAD